MKRQLGTTACAFASTIVLLAAHQAAAQYAVEVRSYDPGTTPAIEFGSGLPFSLTASALGEPSRFTADANFPGVVSPFNSPYKRDQLLSIGEAGQLTLRLSNYALPQVGGKEIGVFANAGLQDVAFPAGQAGTPAAVFGDDSALVEMSADGMNWVSLGNVLLDVPTNGYSDVTDPFAAAIGSVPSDFQQPFVGDLTSFDGLPHFDAGGPDILELLNGSGGGKWLDIPAELTQVGFIRLSVADNGNPNVGLNFELDAVSVSHAALGAATVPEPTTFALGALGLFAATAFSRRRARSGG